ncbi:MAG TPA: C1 family peptidase [Syntrophomonadaceae bacterium]|nr:C1 family peptidase [Syntrophomonadaceae bacterium]
MAGEYYRLRRLMEDLPKEHQGYPLWCLPSGEDPRDFKYLRLIGGAVNQEPTPIDYRSALPPAFDQGQRGSCVACASTWTLKAYEEIKQGDYPTEGLSAAFLYSMCKEMDGMYGQEGTTPRAAMQVLQKYGICGEELMPYSTLTDLPAPHLPAVPDNAVEAAAAFRIKSYAQLCGYGDQDRSQVISAMRQALKQEGPFIMALIVCENFEPDQDGKLPVPAGSIRGGHAVGIVGDMPEQGALIMRNSWGTEWGMDGYALLPYEWINSKSEFGWDVFEAWTATDLSVSHSASKIEIFPEAKTMLVDGVTVLFDQSMDSSVNRFMLPVRTLAEAMGYQVTWYGRKIVLIKPN